MKKGDIYSYGLIIGASIFFLILIGIVIEVAISEFPNMEARTNFCQARGFEGSAKLNSLEHYCYNILNGTREIKWFDCDYSGGIFGLYISECYFLEEVS